ncbi:MAG: P-loop NTPase [Candidatus Latescibacterota bacterium]
MSGGVALAVASGKGGVGKSLVAVNLAVAAARAGRRVLLVDTDLGLGSTAVLLGINPTVTLEEVLLGRCPVEEAASPGPEGLTVLPAASDGGTDLWEEGVLAPRVGEGLSRFEAGFDLVVADTSAGIAPASVDFVAAADECLLLATPEPAAIADAYATLKVVLRRRAGVRAGLLVNMAESPEEARQVCARFQELAARFLGAQIDNRGYIPFDRCVREAVRHQVPFVQAHPPTPAAEAIAGLTGAVLHRAAPSPGPARLFERALAWRTERLAGGPLPSRVSPGAE